MLKKTVAAAALTLCCCLCPPSARADSVWAIVGGESVIRPDRGALNSLGLELNFADNLLETPDELRMALDPNASMNLSEANGLITAIPMGSVRHVGDITIGFGENHATLKGLRLVPTDVDGAVSFAIYSGSRKRPGPMLAVSGAKFGFDRGNNQLMLEAPELLITEQLAAALGNPKLAGLSIGSIELVASAAWAGGDPEAQPVDIIAPPTGGGADPRGVPCSGIVGADVVIGDFHEIYNPSGGAEEIGGVWIDSFAVGTYSCNIGSVDLDWISGDPDGDGIGRHPVIGQNFYRYYTDADGAKRFEQLGQSWLKHGFYALQNDLCCVCGGTGSGSDLGVGCSDPYSASRNAGQSDAGPKWQVNPSTGQHIHPLANPSGYPTTVGRRLQIKVDDLNEADALYFVEGQYVSWDDAAANNKDNNASYRRITVSGTGNNRTFAMADTTQRGEAGLRAWKDQDPTVTETDVQIPSDGLIIVSAKATSLGGGLYHYEYAVENLNSNRGLKSFTVPIEAGATVSSIGFHDVDYHDNDGEASVTRDGTDWASAFTGTAVTWTMSDIGNNSNALLWGTTYNFRFNCNRVPTTNNVTLTMFRSGSPASVVASTVVPAGGFIDCQPNGISDTTDIANGTSRDCNDDGVPDECQTFDSCTLTLQQVVSGLETPVGVYAPPGDTSRLFIVEQTGRIKIASLPSYAVSGTPYLNLSGIVSSSGERGLLGLAFHPNWASNGYFYVNYTNTSGNTVIARYQATGGNPAASTADAGSATILKTFTQPYANHNGGCLQFGPDGKLYCGMGDGGSANDPEGRSQDNASYMGKLIRLDVDNPPTYVPSDNPGSPNLPEVVAKGLRNPWRISFDRENGDLYIGDVGQDAQEEIDYISAGTIANRNFGWRCMEGTLCTGFSGCTCNSGGLTLPIKTESHGDADGTGSLTGGYVYRGCDLPWLNGYYFYADYLGDYIKRFKVVGGAATDLQYVQAANGSVVGIVSFGEDADGEMYVVSLLGTIHKIVCAAPPDLCGNGNVDPGEECDDGNTDPGDGCFQCQYENNDDCADASLIGDGLHGFSTIGMTTDGPLESNCQFDGQTYNDIWFDYVASCTGTLTATTCEQLGGSASYDSDIVLYSWNGIDCLTRVFMACNDDDPNNACGSGSGGYHSTVTGAVTAGQHYLIRVGGYGTGDSGTGSLMVANSGSPCGVCGNSILESGEACDPPGPFCNQFCQFANGDCNDNNVDDGEDIDVGTSFDCNGNGTPDECESQSGATKTYSRTHSPVLAIPDGSGNGTPGAVAASEITVADTGTITDLDVGLVISHTYNGDVFAQLIHNGVTVVLIDRPGYTGSGFGSTDRGFNCTLDDEATTAIETYNPTGTVVITGTHRPNGLLSAFDNMSKTGVWRLELFDYAGGDTGSLTSWSLIMTNPGSPIPPCDCNANGITDSVDIAHGTSADCNNNEIPDSCDIASGAVDCDGGPTGNPAGGDAIINTFCFGCHGPNGFGVNCGGGSCPGPVLRNKSRTTIKHKLLPPTNHPGGAFPSFTDQTFADIEAFLNDTGHPPARPDGIIDSCQTLPDCDNDGTPDGCEFGAGTQADANFNGVPDTCETILTGACCNAGGCTIETSTDCQTGGGDYQGDNTNCSPNPCPPVNDDCANAVLITDGATAFSTVNATTDGPDEPGACTKFSESQVNQDIWYIYTASCTGDLTITTCGAANYDTKIAVYSGLTCPTSSGTAIGCRDDVSGCSGNTTTLVVSVTQGNFYLIRVGGYSTNTGSGTLTISCAAYECLTAAQCDDSDPCTEDTCVNHECVNTPIDTDGDLTPDCVDGCPNDPNKIAAGQCGCGNPDTDTDFDGTADCIDGCPNDPDKIAPGNCGCGVVDTAATGDMDGLDGPTGADLQQFVESILLSSTDPADLCPGDFNNSGVMDVGDADGMVTALLSVP